MKLVTGQYEANAIYWLLDGKQGGYYKYVLLGRYIKGKFEFRNKDAVPGYIYREDLTYDMTPPRIDG
jgi:hypothetical protein